MWATGGVVGRDIGYHGKRKGTVVVDLLGGGEGMGWNENREDVEVFFFFFFFFFDIVLIIPFLMVSHPLFFFFLPHKKHSLSNF